MKRGFIFLSEETRLIYDEVTQVLLGLYWAKKRTLAKLGH